jgi:deoxycytidine triphosphate deaminase
MSAGGVLTHDEIVRRLERGELLRGARRLSSGEYDVEPDSYDLTAGKAVWKEPRASAQKGAVETRTYIADGPLAGQPTVTVQPGQMIFVITYEDVLLPVEICATVYSKNNLAGEGILALNAGHVDPGFQGPIVIRLINLRATPWTLTLGTSIFTIVFQSLGVSEQDKLLAHLPISADDTLIRVRKSAEAALSNALFDLYADEINRRLQEHQSSVEERLRNSLADVFLKRSDFGRALFEWSWRSAVSLMVLAGALAAVLAVAPELRKLFEQLIGAKP